jgi:hypothetical protein
LVEKTQKGDDGIRVGAADDGVKDGGEGEALQLSGDEA